MSTDQLVRSRGHGEANYGLLDQDAQPCQDAGEVAPVPVDSFFLSSLERQPADAYHDTLILRERADNNTHDNVLYMSPFETGEVAPSELVVNTSSSTRHAPSGDDMSSVQIDIDLESPPLSQTELEYIAKVPEGKPEARDEESDRSWNTPYGNWATLAGWGAAILPVTPRACRRKHKRRSSPDGDGTDQQPGDKGAEPRKSDDPASRNPHLRDSRTVSRSPIQRFWPLVRTHGI